jgi:hypothetical protein
MGLAITGDVCAAAGVKVKHKEAWTKGLVPALMGKPHWNRHLQRDDRLDLLSGMR